MRYTVQGPDRSLPHYLFRLQPRINAGKPLKQAEAETGKIQIESACGACSAQISFLRVVVLGLAFTVTLVNPSFQEARG